MSKLKAKSKKCGLCGIYHTPIKRVISLWYRIDEKDVQLCEPCSDKTMDELTKKLDGEKKAIKTLKYLDKKRVVVLTHPGDYVSDELVTTPAKFKLVEKATANDLKDVLQKG